MVAFALSMLSCGGRSSRPARQTTDRRQVISLVDTLSTDTLDFGKVRAGEVVELELLLGNPSKAPILVVTTDTSCGCLKMEYTREPIPSGSTAEAKMTFFSSGYNYFPPRAFYIVTSASHTPKKLVVIADME